MTDKTKTIIVIESHEQTIIRRSRHVVGTQALTDGAVARPLGRASSDATARLAKRRRRRLAAWWRTAALKGVTVFAPWSRRLKRDGNERSNNNHEDSPSSSPS